MLNRSLYAALLCIQCATSALAERRGMHEWGAHEDAGAFACLHCKVAALRAAEAEASDGVRFDAATGRDLRNFAPDRPADLKHMMLRLDIPDMNSPKLSAQQLLTLTAIAKPLDVLSLNAEQMAIESVSLAGDTRIATQTRVTHSYDGDKLDIRFDPPLPPGVEAQVSITYKLDDPVDGLFWTPQSKEWPDRPAQIHTQGQPETNRYWFPAHDFPNERMTTEIITTVPEGFIVISNGREHEPPVTADGRTTFHWLQDKEHVAYLVSLIVGKFDVQDVAPPGSKVRLPVAVPPGKGKYIDQTYGRTPDMIAFFEARLDEPYPWDRYAQTCVWNFGAGGMENTSATTMYDTAILDDKALLDDDLDGLISHELAHQWFGDLITCNTWAHIWLNEGWATYSTALWFEHRDGVQNGYMHHMHRIMRGLAMNDQLAADAKEEQRRRPGMVSVIYKHPWETFRRVSNPYPKGASILHMLRRKLGDDLFFRGVAAYIDRYKLKTVETEDFRRTLEEVSGQSLERFFWQWAMRPGTPKVSVKVSWSEKDKELKLIVDQKQFIDADHPAFAFDLPIEVFTTGPSASTGEGGPVRVSLAIDGKRLEHTIKLDSEPAMVLIDPDLHILMDIEVEAPTPWLLKQMTTPRSLASRLDALHFIRGKGTAKVRETIAAVARDTAEFWSVRAKACETLGKLTATDELVALLESGIEHARVRRAAINALGEIGGPEVVPMLAKHAGDENESYACRSAALTALGRHAPRSPTEAAAEFLPIFAAALTSDSQHDQVRIGAINGLAALDLKDAIGMIIPYTKPGTLARVRPEAIEAISKLSRHDKDLTYNTIVPLLFDREERTRNATMNALVELKDKRGLEVLDRFITSTTHEESRERAENARDRLAAVIDKAESIDAAKAEIERLKTDLKRLEKQVDEKQE